MKIRVVIRLIPGTGLDISSMSLQWCWQGDETRRGSSIQQGSLQELIAWWQGLPTEQQDEPVCLLVPGDLVSCQRVDLNEHQRGHWQQAVPWLLEDSQTTDLDAVHLVSRLVSDEGHARVGCVHHSAMEQLLALFADTDMEVRWIFPEAQFLTGEPGVVRLWIEGEYAYAAEPGGYGQLLDLAALELALPGLLKGSAVKDLESGEEREEGRRGVTIVGGGESPCVEKIATWMGMDLAAGMNAEDVAHPMAFLLSDVAAGAYGSDLVNFRSGKYKCLRRRSRLWRKWRWVAAVVAIGLSLEMLFNLGSGYYFQQRTQQLQQENFAVYKELRPEDNRVVDIRHSLNRFLRAADARENKAVFLGLVNTLSSVSALQVGKEIEFMTMEFNEANSRLTLDVQATGFDHINRFLDALKARGLQASMETGNQDSRGVLARLILKEGQ